MSHTSYFSAPSNYSLQTDNWHPSPSMSMLLLDPEPSWVWEATWTLQTWAQASFLVLGVPTLTVHSVSPTPDHSPQGLLAPPCKGAAFSPWALSCFPKGRTFFLSGGANQRDNGTLAPGHMARTFSSHLMRTAGHSGDDTGTTSWPQV